MESHGVGHKERARVTVRGGGEPEGAGSAVRRATAMAGTWEPGLPSAQLERPAGSTPTLGEVLAAAAERLASHEERAAAAAALHVRCSGCGGDYGLPPGLTPPWGGRVRCPRCTTVFSVGVRREADELIARVAAVDPPGWQQACADHSLWAMWGPELLAAYAALRERHGPQVAARAFRRALEDAAPGVPWFAPPTPANPLEPVGAGVGETMFERRQGD